MNHHYIYQSNPENLKLSQSKPHYKILDGLRGVAAVIVVWFHLFEIHALDEKSGGLSPYAQILGHGYLAVDFFFLLSGFVIGYAYDDRWNKMTTWDFIKRRLIRLQPMIIIGSVMGGLAFLFQESETLGWSVSANPWWKIILAVIVGATLIPVGKYLDVRGWNEMHPLNGPAWSLFFEYIANLVYVLILRRLSTTILSILVLIAAYLTITHLLTTPFGHLNRGWNLETFNEFLVGLIRLAYPFLVGLFISRVAKLKYLPNAFLICSVILVVILAMPRFDPAPDMYDPEVAPPAAWINGIYEIFVIIFIFPALVWLGAGGKTETKFMSGVCKFLGDISYPLYIVHYPIVYVYMAYVTNNDYTFSSSWPIACLLFISAVLLAYLSMKLYDIPVREWLRKKYLTN